VAQQQQQQLAACEHTHPQRCGAAAPHARPTHAHARAHAHTHHATDYLKKIVVKGLTSATTPVRDIMTPADRLAVLTPEHR
jgi:hypothetical protein